MGDLVIRNLDEATARKLRRRAARHGRSVEDEVREILRKELPDAAAVPTPETSEEFYTELRKIVEPVGGIELEPFPDQPIPAPPNFGPRGPRR